MSHDDDLARFLAGELPDDDEAELLPPVALPPGLEDLVLLRLEAEGLVEPPLAGAGEGVPPGLLGATLSRLEAEGLIAAAPAEEKPARWPLVAAVLLAAALGALAGASTSPSTSTSTSPSTSPSTGTPVVDPLAAATLAAETARRVAAEASLRALPAALDAARLRGRLDGRLDGRLEGRREAEPALGDLTRSLDDAREQLAARDDELLAARSATDLARARASALETALDDASAHGAPRALRVDGAEDVLRWDASRGSWAAVDATTALPPGTLVRGDGLTSALTVGGVRLALRDTTFVVVDARRIEPLPDASRRGAAARSAPELRVLVPELIARFASGSVGVRAEAQRELTTLYRRLPDPGPGVVRRMADARLDRAVAGPPVTAEGWEAWWRRVRPTL